MSCSNHERGENEYAGAGNAAPGEAGGRRT